MLISIYLVDDLILELFYSNLRRKTGEHKLALTINLVLQANGLTKCARHPNEIIKYLSNKSNTSKHFFYHEDGKRGEIAALLMFILFLFLEEGYCKDTKTPLIMIFVSSSFDLYFEIFYGHPTPRSQIMFFILKHTINASK